MRHKGHIIGTARLRKDNDPIPMIIVGRVSILDEYQRGGYGSFMFRAINSHLGKAFAMLHAQRRIESFYHKLGWRFLGDEFVEEDILHKSMMYNFEQLRKADQDAIVRKFGALDASDSSSHTKSGAVHTAVAVT